MEGSNESHFRRRLDSDHDNGKIEVSLEDEVNQDKLPKSPIARTVEDINSTHGRIPKEAIPEIGMEFETEEEAYRFYKVYASKMGFSVRRSKEHKDRNGKIIDRVFCCCCEGKRAPDKRDVKVKCPRPETRFGCLAKMKVNSRATGIYRVVQFVPEHSHTLSSQRKTHLHRFQRTFTTAQVAEADMAEKSSIAQKSIVELMAGQSSGCENLGFIPQDYKNYLCSKRTIEMMAGDAGGILGYLQKMQLEDTNFFYAIQVDEDDLIANIFWADGHMMEDYDCFGDVVCFDTTYRKNKGRPFAMFVGVNHHKETTVFGAALLYDESVHTFMWLFDTFAKAMVGKKPMTILTDQDQAMSKALATQWPETCHRLCIWHVYQNATMHLRGIFAKFKEFTKDFSTCLYDYEEEDEFISAWNAMLGKYNLCDNDWLSRLYDIKEKWALVYGRQNFCADMTTTQRNESMNSVLKKYASYNYDLLHFFHHFQQLVDNCRYEELKADFRASQSSPALSFPVEMLKHAAAVYTLEVFKWFQMELCKGYDCNAELCIETESVTQYKITPHLKHRHHVVTYDSSKGTVECTCKKILFVGILCSHALKVLSVKNITRIPDVYIMKRWTKDAKTRIVCATDMGTSSKNDPKMMGKRYKKLCRLYAQLAKRAAESNETYKVAVEGLHKCLEEVDVTLKNIPRPNNALERAMKKAKSTQGSNDDDSMYNVAKEFELTPPQAFNKEQLSYHGHKLFGSSTFDYLGFQSSSTSANSDGLDK